MEDPLWIFFMKIDKDLFLKLQNNIFLIMISIIMKHLNLVINQ